MVVTSGVPSQLDRRQYVRGLVATGGLGALAACLDLSGGDDDSVPSGTDDPSTLPVEQHAWDDALSTDDDGNVRPPTHHVLVALSVAGSVDDEARTTVEAALQGLERAYEWSADGLLFTLGYTPTYFDRVGDDGLAGVDLPVPNALSTAENPSFDEFDALLHLASDDPAVVLEAEAGLFGDRDELNGHAVETDLSTVFERHEDRRRTGFVGEGEPADHTDLDGVPDAVPAAAPFFMGFRSGFRATQAAEARVTIQEGPFAGGTTQHVETIEINLTQWFDQENHYQRVSKLFSPNHAADGLVEGVGSDLGTTSGLTDDHIEATERDARERGVVGHAQKAARARVGGEPVLLRRDFNTVDGDTPGLHFLSVQREIADFVRAREAMNGDDLDVSMANNGIRHYLFVRRRGNYLLPPRDHRALPDASSTTDADT